MTFNTPYIPQSPAPCPPLSLAANSEPTDNPEHLSRTEILINSWQSSPSHQSASKVLHYSYKARVLYEKLMIL